MDYDDNDYQGQNLHLAGEESSKESSVLCPYVLPKFDFDDSLQGHLRFDSLVENEVFLGIASQEDNQWIEDFSRGNSGIGFSSSAAESCSLRRHNNVWSEATSSESVEMLLKAVGQEEMVPGETIIEETDPGDQLGGMMEQTETNLRQDDKIDDVNDHNPTLTPGEPMGNVSELNESVGAQGVHLECALPAHGAKVFDDGSLDVNSEKTSLVGTSENLQIDMKRSDDCQGQAYDSANESLRDKMHDNMSNSVMENDNTECTLQNVTISAGELNELENVSHIETDSLNDLEKGNCKEGEEESIANAEMLGGKFTETVNSELHSPVGVASNMESIEDRAVETSVTGFEDQSSIPQKGESASVTVERCNADAVIIVSGGGSKCEVVSLSEGTEINQQVAVENKLHEGTSVAVQAEGSIEAQGNPSEQDNESSINHANSLDNLTNVSVTADVSRIQTEDSNDVEPDRSPLLSGSMQIDGENHLPKQADSLNYDQDLSADVKEDEKSHLVPSDMGSNDNTKVVGSTVSVDVVNENVDSAPGSNSNTNVTECPVLNTEVEDKNCSSLVGDHNADHKTPLHDTGSLHQGENEGTEFEVPKEPSTSISEESLEMTDKLGPVSELQKAAPSDPDVKTGSKTVNQPVLVMEASGSVIGDKIGQDLAGKMETCPVQDMIVQGEGSESAPVEKPMDKTTERSHGVSSSTTPEFEQSNQVFAAGISCTQHVRGEINKQESLKETVVENAPQSHGDTFTNSGVNDISKEEGTFTFDVRPLASHSKGETGRSSQPFPDIQAFKISLAVDASTSTSDNRQIDPKAVQEISHGSPLGPDVRVPSRSLKSSSERKTRRGSGKSGKESGKKGIQVKETTPVRQNERGEKSSVSLSQSGTGQLMQFETGNVERTATKPGGVVSISAAYLPDLNTSTSPSALFQQPFTDLQQVQLRAQIFVYGSLIQGAAPDEACMVSVFDGGRSIWEPAWRACVERLHGQKSLKNSETPVQTRSGRTSGKATPSSAVNPMNPLSSPLWNLQTPSCDGLPSSNMARGSIFDYQAVSPLHPYQTPIRSFVAPTTSLLPQSPFSGPWLASSQSPTLDISTRYSAFPITEPVKLTPVKELSLPISSGPKHGSPIAVTNSGASSVLPVPSLPSDLKKVTVSSGQNATDPKTRKRKKPSGAEDLVQSSTAATHKDPGSAPVINSHLSKKAPVVEDLSQVSLLANVSSHYSTPVTITTPSTFIPKINSENFFVAASPSISSEHHRRGDINMEKSAINLEDFGKVGEAKFQAEEAAAHAATAISCCESVWIQLNKQKNTGLTSDAEANLASAAVSIAAAAAVAKAAAAAAKIALNAAVQAKQMADEAVTTYGAASVTENNTVSVPVSLNNLGNATPASILKGVDGNSGSSSILSVAREAARKKVEAASAATKHAENLDAIVKAAELAAEAVSQAGKIVAMGDPLPLIELAEAGPDGYWKVLREPSLQVSEPSDRNTSKSNNNSLKPPVIPPVNRELSRNTMDDEILVEESLIASVKHRGENSKAQKDRKASDSAKNIGIVSESDIESISNSLTLDTTGSTGVLREGCLVEVLKDHGDIKGAWFSANLLSLKDGEALVHYANLQSDEGSEQLKEWVPLSSDGDRAPVVRIPHPMATVQFEGARKRRRAAIKDYVWSVGDRVDAYVEDCWREGVIAEKHENDETTLSIRFPDQWETSVVKAFNLRPTLIWSDGQWVEWSRSRQDGSSQGDTPQEKRLKHGSSAIEAKGKGKMSKSVDFVETGHEESRLLPLSANEKVFNVGSTRDHNKPDARTMRSGLQKDGSRVIFGVPKPGKKRKFMDVSKHYVSDGSMKTNVPSDSVKLAKYLIPQGSGSRGWKNSSNIDLKEKLAPESKSKALNSGKAPGVSSRTLSRKDDPISSLPTGNKATLADSVKGMFRNDENEPGPSQDTRKRASAASTKPERTNKVKLVPTGRRPAKVESSENFVSDGSEPRRSNRRIQPTSRLLEGLQSSLIMPKILASSHDKTHKSYSKSTSRGNSNHG